MRDELSSLGIDASEDPSEYGSMAMPASKGDKPFTACSAISDQNDMRDRGVRPEGTAPDRMSLH